MPNLSETSRDDDIDLIERKYDPSGVLYGDVFRLTSKLREARNERDALRTALAKATHVLERTTVLFHPQYLLHTNELLTECKAALMYVPTPNMPEPTP